jgi:hypothetical protein
MDNLIVGLIGAVVTLAGYSWFQKSKRKSAEALNDNLETKEKLVELDKSKQVDSGTEERNSIKETLNEALKGKVDEKALTDFFTDYFKRR